MKYLSENEIQALVKEFFGHTHDAMTCRHAMYELQRRLKILNGDTVRHGTPQINVAELIKDTK